jgi:hypothetical protein
MAKALPDQVGSNPVADPAATAAALDDISHVRPRYHIKVLILSRHGASGPFLQEDAP